MLTIKPPKTEYSGLSDVGKFNMIWNVSFVLVPIFFTLFLIHLFFGDSTWMTSLIACVFALFNVIVLYYTRKYLGVAIFSVIVGILVCQAVIFIVPDAQLISNVLWCVLISFFAFYMLGSIVGTAVLLINLTGMVVYFSRGNVDSFATGDVDHKMIVDVYYVALALAFVVYKMMANNNEVNKRYEREIARNEILLKEIHHRVKNNLQIVSSLLKLQAADSEDASVKEHFDEAISRIRSMALIHEKMYHNDDLSKIKIEPYLIALAEDICASLCSDGNLEMDVQSDVDKVDVKSIVPISLIFNELMTNSMKHGFAGLTSGKIDVQIKTNGSNTEFIYRDNGKWKEPVKEDTFGLDLLNTLTEQLEGTLVRNLENGTMYTFSFPTQALFFQKEENQD